MLYNHLSAYLAILATVHISVTAVPLNINLGAYSPAIVVGDGEISFGSGEHAEAVLNTLAGAGVTGEGSASEAPASEASTPESDPEASPTESASRAKKRNELQLDTVAGSEVEDEDEDLDESEAPIAERDLAGFNAALAFAAVALKTSPGIELGTGEGGSGVGIIVRPGVDAGAATPAPAPAEKR
ncbi:hypothetical protein PZA11_004629 [Diplocarpon coronariae]